MLRSAGVAIAAGGLVLALVGAGATLAGAHGNHVSANAQVVGNDRVVVESYFTTEGGFLVIHADDGGEPGRVLGHTEALQGLWTDVTVSIDAADLPTEGDATLWAVLHRDDGDGEFHPDDDPPIEGFGAVAGSPFPVRAGPGPVAVVATSDTDRRSNGSVVLDRVELASPGHVVVHADDGGDPGQPVGHTTLGPGTHREVSVTLESDYFAAQGLSFGAHPVVHDDDGDCVFDPDDDPPVTVGDDPVSTRLSVFKHEDASVDPTQDATPTPSGDACDELAGTVDDGTDGGDGAGDGSEGGDGAGDGGDGGDGAGDDSEGDVASDGSGGAGDGDGSGPGGDGGGDLPLRGFGVGLVLVAVLVALSVRRLR